MFKAGHGNHFITSGQFNAAHTSRVAASENADIADRKADTFTFTGCQEHIVVFFKDPDPHQMITFVELHGDFAIGIHIGEVRELVPPDPAGSRREHNKEITPGLLVFW